MLRIMERLFDSKGFPEAYMSPRAFDSARNNKNIHEMEENIAVNDAMNPTSPLEQDGTRCTFEIAVKFRQNATWQGQILWTEKNLKQNFRSALEMLLLMDEALAGEGDAPDHAKWEGDAPGSTPSP